MKIFLLIFSAISLLATPAMAKGSTEKSRVELLAAEGITLMRITAIHGKRFSYIKALEQFAASVDQESEGRIKVELLLGGEAGSEAEALKKQIRRKLEGGLTSATTLAHSLPAFRLLTLPLLFTAPSHVENFINSPLDLNIRDTASKKNLKVLGYGSYGFYGLLAFDPDTENREINITDSTTPEEVEASLLQNMIAEHNQPARSFTELSVRAPTDLWMSRIHKALSIKQVTVPAADLKDAIESGWVNGIISTPETLANTSYPATASHYFDIRQQHGWSVFTVNKIWFNRLPSDLKQIIQEAVTATSQVMQQTAFQHGFNTREAWASAGWPEIVVSEAAELEAAFRPLAFRSARKLERTLGMPHAIRDLWNKNRTPQSNSWPTSTNHSGGISATGVEVNELIMRDTLKEKMRRVPRQ